MKIGEVISFLEENKNKTKIHCATGDIHNFEALYVLSKGNFKEWQEGQSKKNFERDYILSIIYMAKNEWLFAGIYRSMNVNEITVGENVRGFIRPGKYLYDTELTEYGKELIGKMVINFEKEFRQSYLLLENYIDDLTICEIKRHEYKFDPFSGYTNVDVQFDLLKEIIKNNEKSWETALSNVKGI